MGEVYIQVGINNLVLTLLKSIYPPFNCFRIIFLKVSLSRSTL